ncbi:MAG: SanA/YdcF family protein [Lewinella sp.]|uniref:SanA/YdcF family protein n=1 Tax=Lewinella sp. TaxID=2004506 RepID=UPI003D6BF2D8
MKKWLKISAFLILLVVIVTILNYHYVKRQTATSLFTNTSAIPPQKVGLVLGTSKYLAGGQINLYYHYRITAAQQLFEAGKVQFLLLSGDNGTKEYNEPAQMKEDLVALGIPADRIYLDYAGFRTLDSVVRAKEIFGQKSFICISQPFHVARAIYIGQQHGLEVSGYVAQEVSLAYGYTVLIREYLARMKMQLDLIFGKAPKYLGEKITIE